MDKNNCLVLFHVLTLLSCIPNSSMAVRLCGNCGQIPVPYPLSTGPGCGDALYKLRCTYGTLWLDALNGSSYEITSINPLTQRIIIRPDGLAGKTCVAADFHSQGIHLDQNLPFKISSSNTILLLNCTNAMQKMQPPINCASTSLCHDYIRANAVACGATSLCCTFTFKAGGSQTSYFVRVQGGECAAYQSFVNFDPKLDVKKWPSPGMELEWVLPQEPICKSPVDCKELLNSRCLANPVIVGQTRCLCNVGFKWDPINGLCQGKSF